MANKDLFKQAIAEAKSVREAAIANAKEALEETLTPHLKDMLAAKLQEMEDSKDFISAIKASSGLSVIAEIKRRSPSKGGASTTGTARVSSPIVPTLNVSLNTPASTPGREPILSRWVSARSLSNASSVVAARNGKAETSLTGNAIVNSPAGTPTTSRTRTISERSWRLKAPPPTSAVQTSHPSEPGSRRTFSPFFFTFELMAPVPLFSQELMADQFGSLQ